MGLYKRGNIWWMCYQNDKGIRERRSAETGNKKEADDILSKIKTEIKEDKWFDNTRAKMKTFDEMMIEYFKKIENDKDSTYQRKSGAFQHLCKAFTSLTLNKITPDSIEEYIRHRLANQAAHSTILNEIRLLSHAFNTVRWCKENPVRHVKHKLKSRMVDRWLTDEEEKKLLTASEEGLDGQLQDIIMLDLATGLSQEELLNLKWERIDFNRNALTTTRSKTETTRTLPLKDEAIELLKRRNKVRALTGYVFFNGAGNRIDAGKLKKTFGRAVKKAGIKHLRFHDLRHTFATRLLHKGVDIYSVSKLLGHKDIGTTQRYAHHNIESLRDAFKVTDDCHNFVTVNENKTKDVQANIS